MTGFEAIAHHNGWLMAGFGAAIVFTGLAVLSFVISQLPRVFGLFERTAVDVAAPAPAKTSDQPTLVEPRAPADADAAGFDLDPTVLARTIEPLLAGLDEPFQLADLYRLCREHDLPHPHLSLSCLQRQGYLVFQGDGSFVWKVEHANAQEG